MNRLSGSVGAYPTTRPDAAGAPSVPALARVSDPCASTASTRSERPVPPSGRSFTWLGDLRSSGRSRPCGGSSRASGHLPVVGAVLLRGASFGNWYAAEPLEAGLARGVQRAPQEAHQVGCLICPGVGKEPNDQLIIPHHRADSSAREVSDRFAEVEVWPVGMCPSRLGLNWFRGTLEESAPPKTCQPSTTYWGSSTLSGAGARERRPATNVQDHSSNRMVRFQCPAA
jgi:hypothetical protein